MQNISLPDECKDKNDRADKPDLKPFGDEPKVFGFFLHPDFSMLAFTSAVEPLRSANRLSGRKLYEWRIISQDGKPVASSSQIEVVPHGGISDFESLPYVIVVAGLSAQLIEDKKVFGWLRRLARRGSQIGALTTGSYTLAKAGLLDGYRCTIHWENISGFQEDFPEIEVTGELFEIDRNRFTCSGGTASLDLMLSLMAKDHGRELATQVAEQFIHERIRDNHDQQRMSLRSRLGISHPRLLKVIELMENNLEEPLARSELARQTGLSTRQLERLFRKYLSRTPTRYYQELRLQRARTLLSQTSLSVLDVALACGFVSASHFSKCYREFYTRTPREERQLSLLG
ncbi:MAG: GlxA family transcriptional regulator [Kiloniellales bacterium]|nr:GlxA family transcriptional regulator [Kiloniellales bacterium]